VPTADATAARTALSDSQRQRIADLIQRAAGPTGRTGSLHEATCVLAQAAAADRAAALVPVGRGVLRVVASSELADLGDLIVSLERYPELAHVLTERSPILIPDATTAELLTSQAEVVRAAGIRSIAAVPVHLGEVVGILRLTSRSRPLDERSLAVLIDAAAVVADTVARSAAPDDDESWKRLALRVADAVFDVALDGRILAVHGTGHGRLVSHQEGLLDRSLLDVFPQLDRGGGETSLLDLLTGESPPWDAPFLIRLEDRAPVPVRLTAERRGGLVPGIRVSIRRWEPAFDSPDELLQHLPIPVLGVHRSSAGIAFANRAAERLIGQGIASLAGRPITEILRGGPDDATLARRGARPLPVNVVRRQEPLVDMGLDLWVLLDASALTAARERAAMMRSRLERQRDELEQMYQQMDDFEALRSRFLSASAHELKTPLTIIQTYLETLRTDLADGFDGDQREFIDVCYESTLRLRRLVADLLDLAALETGKIQLEIGRVDVLRAVERVVREMTPIAKRAGIELVVRSDGRPAPARADLQRVEQILRNLVDNALKFTLEGGHVTVVADTAGDSVRLEVHDTGVGIPATQLETVFEEFVQVESTQQDRQRGSGLGLSVCRRIVRAMGGRISVSSEPGVGSVFSVLLPCWPDELAASDDTANGD
jgi:signal transduction histidine kinase